MLLLRLMKGQANPHHVCDDDQKADVPLVKAMGASTIDFEDAPCGAVNHHRYVHKRHYPVLAQDVRNAKVWCARQVFDVYRDSSLQRAAGRGLVICPNAGVSDHAGFPPDSRLYEQV